MADRLFDIEDFPEAPLFRPPRRSRGEHDARFRGEYPPAWNRCLTCLGEGIVITAEMPSGLRSLNACPDCLGMGSMKARVRLEAGHRCLRCRHPYVPKSDAAMILRLAELLGQGDPVAEPSFQQGGWSACDGRFNDPCRHAGPARAWTTEGWVDFDPQPAAYAAAVETIGRVEAQWRILTVHHADGDKENLAWWNLLALCQRCHLEIQAKVVMERVYPHEHTAWFRPFVAGYYAHVYLGEDLTREETEARLDELLALERGDA